MKEEKLRIYDLGFKDGHEAASYDQNIESQHNSVTLLRQISDRSAHISTSKTMKVAKWVSWSEVEKGEMTHVQSGGFFERGMRWNDFIEGWSERGIQYFNALRESVLENNIRVTGEQHQQDDRYVPVFDDGWIVGFTWRAWGDLMAAVWSEHDNKDYSYMDFYM